FAKALIYSPFDLGAHPQGDTAAVTAKCHGQQRLSTKNSSDDVSPRYTQEAALGRHGSRIPLERRLARRSEQRCESLSKVTNAGPTPDCESSGGEDSSFRRCRYRRW